MSGHSHWATIKRKKGTEDEKRGRLFGRLAKEIAVAAREGASPEDNPRLRQVLDKARAANMPAQNIERAIKRGAGEEKDQALQELLVEAYGPGGIALLIEGITDNRNRTMGEIRQALGKHGGKLVEGGAVRWLFDRKGVVRATPRLAKQEAELAAIDAGAEDFSWQEDEMELYAKAEDAERLRSAVEQKGFFVRESGLEWVPKENVSSIEVSAAERLFEAVDELDDVQNIYTNLE